MDSMYKRSKIFKEQAITCIGKISEDDSYMSIACFDCHQALELLLKSIIEMKGYQAPKTHCIDDLLVYLEQYDFYYDKAEELKAMAYEINKWETTSRYGAGIKTTVSKIDKVLEHIDSIDKLAYKDIVSKTPMLDKMSKNK